MPCQVLTTFHRRWELEPLSAPLTAADVMWGGATSLDVSAPQCLQPGGGEGLLAARRYVAPMVDAAIEGNGALAQFSEARQAARGEESA